MSYESVHGRYAFNAMDAEYSERLDRIAAAKAAIPVTAADERIATDRWLAKVTAADVLDQLTWDDWTNGLDVALARRDARLIGQLFLAAQRFMAQRVAWRELTGEPRVAPTAKQAVADVFVHATGAIERRTSPIAACIASVRFARASGAELDLSKTEAALVDAARQVGGAA